ncbi:MAG: V-type ATP synthase subunit D [Nitrospirales bacterium]|nr:V-type ATP synthase subunit D [Nitrospirales bacterium]
MARFALSKSALQRERQNLKMFERFLPSLDLKRRQLMAEQSRALEALSQVEAQVATLVPDTGRSIPMLANKDIEIGKLVQIESVQIGEENVVGVRLPVLEKVDTKMEEYALLAKPHWVDAVGDRLREILELKIQIQVLSERVLRLDQAIRRTTQRVNLFDKVLIPGARKHIKRIQIFLADTERAAVVRSKIAKGRHEPTTAPT